jgi:glutathionyl-hydroquinone reductase
MATWERSVGLLVEGEWKDQWYDTRASKGRFERQPSRFRNWVTADGSAGPTGTAGFKAEPGRYHLYISLACPWAHRSLISRRLKQLDDLISVSSVSPNMRSEGWTFDVAEGSTGDAVNGAQRLYEVYLIADGTYSGRW